MLHDLRYATRSLRSSPGFAAVAVLTLGLGIGATTAIFAVVDAVMLQPLPFREAERLVHVELDRVSPLAVPVMVMIGRESLPQGAADEELLLEAEGLAGAAMRIDAGGG